MEVLLLWQKISILVSGPAGSVNRGDNGKPGGSDWPSVSFPGGNIDERGARGCHGIVLARSTFRLCLVTRKAVPDLKIVTKLSPGCLSVLTKNDQSNDRKRFISILGFDNLKTGP